MSSQQRNEQQIRQHNLVPTSSAPGPGPGTQMTIRVPSEHGEPHPQYADSAILPSIPVTRVMSPTLTMFGEGQGWLALTTCPGCDTFVRDPVLCTACGRFGHPACLGAEMFQGLPFCGICFSEIIAEYSGRRDAEKREEWRKTNAAICTLEISGNYNSWSFNHGRKHNWGGFGISCWKCLRVGKRSDDRYFGNSANE